MKNIVGFLFILTFFSVSIEGKKMNSRPIKLEHGTMLIVKVLFTPDSTRFASASSSGTVIMWDLKSKKKLWEAAFDEKKSNENFTIANIRRMEISPDGKKLVVGFTLGTVVNNQLVNKNQVLIGILDALTGEIQKKIAVNHEGVTDLSFSPDGKIFASSGDDGKIFFWDVSSGQQIDQLDVSRPVGSLSFSPDLRLMGVGFSTLESTDGNPAHATNFAVIDRVTKEKIKDLSLEGCRYVVDLDFSPDGRFLVVLGETDTQITQWDTNNWSLVRTLKNEAIGIGGLTFTRDGKILGSCDWSGGLFLYSMELDKKYPTFNLGVRLRTICLSPNGKTIVLGSDDGSVLVLEAADLDKVGMSLAKAGN